MIPFLRLAAVAAVACLLLPACGQKGPLFMPKVEEAPPPLEKAKEKPKAKPKAVPQQSPAPEASPQPEAPSPDDDPQDSFSPMSDQSGY